MAKSKTKSYILKKTDYWKNGKYYRIGDKVELTEIETKKIFDKIELASLNEDEGVKTPENNEPNEANQSVSNEPNDEGGS